MSDNELTKRLDFFQLTGEALKAAQHQHNLACVALLDFYGVKPNTRFFMTRQFSDWYQEQVGHKNEVLIGQTGTIVDIHSDRVWIAFPECNVPVPYENLYLLAK